MIEIKITIDEAVQLLLDRMKLEIGTRQKSGIITAGLRLENLSYKELISIVDSAIIDTIFFLPINILTSETNLVHIIASTVRSLSKILGKEELVLFTESRAKFLIEPIVEQIQSQIEKNIFLQN
jgi:hypothetical protein